MWPTKVVQLTPGEIILFDFCQKVAIFWVRLLKKQKHCCCDSLADVAHTWRTHLHLNHLISCPPRFLAVAAFVWRFQVIADKERFHTVNQITLTICSPETCIVWHGVFLWDIHLRSNPPKLSTPQDWWEMAGSCGWVTKQRLWLCDATLEEKKDSGQRCLPAKLYRKNSCFLTKSHPSIIILSVGDFHLNLINAKKVCWCLLFPALPASYSCI